MECETICVKLSIQVTIIFQEPDALPFYPTTVRSHFQHVFIVVRVTNPLTPNVSYSVAVVSLFRFAIIKPICSILIRIRDFIF